jgi:hypothetical protein
MTDNSPPRSLRRCQAQHFRPLEPPEIALTNFQPLTTNNNTPYASGPFDEQYHTRHDVQHLQYPAPMWLRDDAGVGRQASLEMDSPNHAARTPRTPSVASERQGFDPTDNDQTRTLLQSSSTTNTSQSSRHVDYEPPNLLPWFNVIVPPLIVPGALVAIIRMYRVPRQQDLFHSPQFRSLYLLVNLEDTRIMFVASFLNTISPIVANYIMGLYAPRVVQQLTHDIQELSPTDQHPSIHEIATIGGICQGSSFQFIKSMTPRFRERNPTTEALHRAKKAYRLFISMWPLSYAATGLLHLTTQMVEHDLLDFSQQYKPSRALRPRCEHFDRSKLGLPCSQDSSTPDFSRQLREGFRLQRNASTTSQIEFVATDTGPPNLGLILSRNTPSTSDYVASTFGLRTECSYVTPQCHMHDGSNDPEVEPYRWTIFNCSRGVWGALGKNPIVVDLFTATDEDIPHLTQKPSMNLQYGYFFDPGLAYPYNPVGWDQNFTRGHIRPYSDSELINPIYLGVAGRIGNLGLGEYFPGNQDVWSGHNRYYDFAMRCKLTAYNVTYSFINGSVNNVSASDSIGSILEIFHGSQFYDIDHNDGSEYVEMLTQAALQNSTSRLAQRWETLFTAKALSVIGSVTEEHPAIIQQDRNQILVAQLMWPALAFLFFCSLLHIVTGISVILSIRRLTRPLKLMGEIFSTPGAILASSAEPSVMPQALKRVDGDDKRGVAMVRSRDGWLQVIILGDAARRTAVELPREYSNITIPVDERRGGGQGSSTSISQGRSR